VAPKPVNLLINAPFLTVAQAAELGVRRISVGGTLARTAWGGFLQAAQEIADSGTFSSFAGLRTSTGSSANRVAPAASSAFAGRMSSHLAALVVDANDPLRLARFWAGVLGRELDDDAADSADGVVVLPSSDNGFAIDFAPTEAPKTGPNQMHFDLTSSSLEEQRATVARALELGGRHLDIGQGPDVDHVVLADPEGNEFCVIEPGNNFLADTGVIGALSSDGPQEVGYFWSRALGWPLVWDQDEETAIQSPQGGTKISWGGPPVAPKLGKNRLHLDIAPPAGDDQDAEVERLIALGAKHVDIGQGDVSWVVLADPDGNEFCVLTPR
jgi:predicted enzyme related to lactoylglutathione lyase